MKLSIVIPCYNEAENIPLLLERFGQTIRRKDIEMILVDNGSVDATKEILKDLLPRYPAVRSIRVKENRGYGFGIVQGLKVCQGTFVGWTHADMQTDPADVLKALHIIEQNNNNGNLFVKGQRKGRPLWDQFFTSGMSIFESVYFGQKIYDVNAQPNVFSREFFQTWNNPPDDFALDLYALYMANKNGLCMKRFDVAFPKRIYGESHWNHGLGAKWKFIKRTMTFSRKMKKDGMY